MTGVKAVIFDMYDTLVQNNPTLWRSTFNEICQTQQLNLDGQTLWDTWKAKEINFREERYGPSYPFKTYEQAWHECFTEVFREINQGDASHATSLAMRDQGNRPLFHEVLEVITKLYNGGVIRIGLLSNADNKALGSLIRSHGLAFHQIMSSETAQAYKPISRAFELMLELLQIPASECLYVGDSQHDDVLGAKLVGMRAAWVNRNNGVLNASLPSPDYEISDLRGLFTILGLE